MAKRVGAAAVETGEEGGRDQDDLQPECSKKRKLAYSGAAKYQSKFKSEWCKSYPIRAVPNDHHSFFCVPCKKSIRCGHQGLKDVKDHCATETHNKLFKATKIQPSVAQLFRDSSASEDVIRAEVMVTNFLIQHNLPLATADHLGPLFKVIFPDSNIAKSYACGRTKTSAIINKAMGPHCHEYLVEHCKSHPFSIGIDGSSDTEESKMNPMTIRIFDLSRSKTVTTHFYDMCITSGRDAAKAESVFRSMESKLIDDEIPWSHVVSLSVDNTNSMVGIHNSLASRCRSHNPEIFLSRCPCHLVHIAASHAHDAFSEIAGVNVEDLLIDLYYWFDKSTKRKGVLAEYMVFCNQEYAKILKHGSTRWLSLERCIQRTLEKYSGLKSYFLSEHFSESRFMRLQNAFKNPLTEITLLFHHASISLFTNFNKLMQSDEPLIHVVYESVVRLAKTIANRIIKPEVVKEIGSISELVIDNPHHFIPALSIHLGATTKFSLQKLLSEGDIVEAEYAKIFTAAQRYFKEGLKYILQKFPIGEEVFQNAKCFDVQRRSDAKWESIEFFVAKFNSIFASIDMDRLYDEFCDYKTLTDEEIGRHAWNEAKVIDGSVGDQELFHYRADTLWWHIGHMVVPDSSCRRFSHLLKVAELVLILPHSNAGEERLFSMVRKNKTDSRSRLKLDGTLSNLLAMKLQYPECVSPCYKFNPSKSLLSDSKKATTAYNAEHKTKNST